MRTCEDWVVTALLALMIDRPTLDRSLKSSRCLFRCRGTSHDDHIEAQVSACMQRMRLASLGVSAMRRRSQTARVACGARVSLLGWADRLEFSEEP
jgi:hypothetical protein